MQFKRNPEFENYLENLEQEDTCKYAEPKILTNTKDNSRINGFTCKLKTKYFCKYRSQYTVCMRKERLNLESNFSLFF